MKETTINRGTTETEISLTLNLYGKGEHSVSTGVGFFDHMLELFAAHGRFNLAVNCKGDIHVDNHHTVEDIGICLGRAISEALGEKRGITRYGSVILPMDEALVLVSLDLSGRAHLSLMADIPNQPGGFGGELLEEFLIALCRSAGMTLHVHLLSGKNAHHIIEAVLKGLGRALAQAVSPDPRLGGGIMSTKGVL
jgi:imidazoleglycerol-phosphate dehydratase